MANVVSITKIKTTAGNVKLKPDSDGYYEVVLGAFNVPNSQGVVYLGKPAMDILNNPDSVINKRLSTGRLRSEADHPEVTADMTNGMIVTRQLDISNKCVCGFIKEINIIETDKSAGIPGIGNIVIIKGKIKPSGAFGDALKASLDNPEEDTCFSVRSFAKELFIGSTKCRRNTEIVTYDWVNAPGIKYASKLHKLAIESEDIIVLDLDEVTPEEVRLMCANESEDVKTSLNRLFDTTYEEDVMSSWCK